ncbi:patatin-like protein 3 isoform X1 [Musa acuminata AAA Group]|uniref:patatin-like protein 3 isoform X1 n=1 Tax=Musa acuminata AAA Group TaxID=214697 RepID=UPI0031CF88A5
MAFVDADKLSYEIFSVLESKFLFGLDDPNKLFFPTSSYSSAGASPRTAAGARGRIRILSIDGGGSPSDALLAAVALARLESSLRHLSGDPSARVTDMFDVAAGSGAGGVLVAMLFTRDHDGRPLFSATDALHLLLSESRRRGRGFSSGRGLFRGMFRRPGSFFRRIFGDATLRDTVKPVLIPCYDLATGAPFLFSRADAVEADGYDFRMWEVCAATCADASNAAVDLRSVDGRTRVTAVGAAVAMANPVAAAITHVLHNKPEFPFAAGVQDLMVVSLGASAPAPAAPGAAELVRIAGEGFADMVDQAVATAFGHGRASNYLRIQPLQDTALMSGNCTPKTTSSKSSVEAAERVLSQRHVESLLFRGRGKISERTNGDELDRFAEELVKEEEWRKKGPIPTVVLKQVMTPRTSSATTATTVTVTTTISTSTTST